MGKRGNGRGRKGGGAKGGRAMGSGLGGKKGGGEKEGESYLKCILSKNFWCCFFLVRCDSLVKRKIDEGKIACQRCAKENTDGELVRKKIYDKERWINKEKRRKNFYFFPFFLFLTENHDDDKM